MPLVVSIENIYGRNGNVLQRVISQKILCFARLSKNVHIYKCIPTFKCKKEH